MNRMKYRGYSAVVDYDANDRIFVGHVSGIRDIVGFHGTTVVELETAFHDAIDHYLELCEKSGRQPQKVYSGKLTLRIEPEIHAAVANAAASNRQSINQWAAGVLNREARSAEYPEWDSVKNVQRPQARVENGSLKRAERMEVADKDVAPDVEMTPAERARRFRQWAARAPETGISLPDGAFDRDTIYE